MGIEPAAAAFGCDVVLKDGSTLTLREGRDTDTPAVEAFLAALSDVSHYQRFAGTTRLKREAVRQLTAPAPDEGFALLGECGGRVVALAGYYHSPRSPHRAEVAFAIADAVQGRGIGMRLLERLGDVGRMRGVTAFDAYVLEGNRAMLDVFTDSGFAVRQTLDSGIVHVTLSLAATGEFLERAAQRAQTAARNSLRPFFEPRGVAVIGASRTRGKIGTEILRNLVSVGFRGGLYAVHPSAAAVEGVPAFARVPDIPGAVDLAIIAVPAAQVLPIVDDCIRKGVRGICVISAGFAESGGEGQVREHQLIDKIRAAGCRLIGPNCMGLLNTDAAVALNATFSPVYPPAGAVAMSTQSGALGLAILDYARRLNIGISTFVSVGNKADVSGNDLLQYWYEDPRTRVILLYLESFGNPRRFRHIARRVARQKPIVAVKAGRSRAGARAAASHTGAIASADRVVDTLFRQAGVIRTETLEELFDVAALLANQPLPRGGRLAVLTNAGGPGILAADAAEAEGLELASLSAATREALRAFLPPSASTGNPVDMLASAPPDHFSRAAAAILADDGVDALLVIFIPPLVTEPEAVARAVAASAAGAGKPVLGVFMRAEGAPPGLAPIPCYAFPESAVIALARAVTYSRWRAEPPDPDPLPRTVDRAAVLPLIAPALARAEDNGWLRPDEAAALMRAIGIDTPPGDIAGTADEAVRAAVTLGFPVAVKAFGPGLLHKTERRAVVLHLRDADAVREACLGLAERLPGEMSGFHVQRMVEGGVEMLVGATADPLFGPLVVCGSGGVFVDLVGDSAARLAPVSEREAAAMIDELKVARLLRGFRGAPAADEGALRTAIQRVAALAEVCPEIVELDINPLTVLASGACALDVRVRVERPWPAPPSRRIEY